MERIYRDSQRPAAKWLPHEYMLLNAAEAAQLPTKAVPAGSVAYTVDRSTVYRMGADGQWHDVSQTLESVPADAEIATNGEVTDYLGIV